MPDIRTLPAFDLTGPEEHPMRLGGRWGPVDTTWPENYKDQFLSFGADHPTDNGSGIWWSLNNEGIYTGDVEAWGKPVGGQFGAAGEGWRIGIWDSLSLGGGGTARGYVAMWFAALGSLTAIRKYTSPGSWTYLASNGSTPPWGGHALFRRRGNFLEVWTGDGTGDNWGLQLSVEDTTWTNNMMIAFCSEDPTHGGLGWTGVGGGQKNRQFIYRILRGT